MGYALFARWVRLLLLVAALLFVLEFAIEYLWLGRHWAPGRMWINLVLVTYAVMVFWEFIAWLKWWVFLLVTLLSGLTFLAIPQTLLNPLFQNPAIDWKGGQQFLYIVAVVVISICIAGRVDDLVEASVKPLFGPEE